MLWRVQSQGAPYVNRGAAPKATMKGIIGMKTRTQ